MGKVTAITPQVKDDKRVNVYIDGAFACGLSLEAAVKNKVKVGAEIDEARLKEIEFDSEKTSAMEKTAAFISKTMKTEREVALFLARKGYSEVSRRWNCEETGGDYRNGSGLQGGGDAVLLPVGGHIESDGTKRL